MKIILVRMWWWIMVLAVLLPANAGAVANGNWHAQLTGRTRAAQPEQMRSVQPAAVNAPGDENWDDRFAPDANGLNCNYQCGIKAIVPDNAGNVYILGEFYKIGSPGISTVARWDGTAWNALGSGNFNYNAIVNAMAVSGSDVYVGGLFTAAGGVPADSIAHWDGTAWQAMGTGIKTDLVTGEMVYAIAVNGSDVYAAGEFTSAGGITVTNIARWDGLAWHALSAPGSGPVGCGHYCTIKELVVSGGDIFAYGTFTGPGGGAINTVARWDGSVWHVMERDFSAEVVSGLAIANGNIYLAGNFSHSEPTYTVCADPWEMSSLAVWNGSDWSYPTCSTHGSTDVIAVDGTDIYVAEGSGVYPVHLIKRWNGAIWQSLGSGVNSYVGSIAVANKQVYVGGGLITSAGGKPSSMFAIWHMPTAPTLLPSYPNGAPGSTFSYSAENFPPNTPVTITVNAYTFPAQMTDANGRLTLTLHTALAAQNGRYIVTFSVAPLQGLAPSAAGQAYTIFDLSSSAPTRMASGPTPLELPDSVAPAHLVFVPVVAK